MSSRKEKEKLGLFELEILTTIWDDYTNRYTHHVVVFKSLCGRITFTTKVKGFPESKKTDGIFTLEQLQENFPIDINS